MKKLLILVVSLILVCSAMLGGCSCSSATPLSLQELHYDASGNSTPPVGYSQTLTYQVDYAEKYGTAYQKDSGITDQLIAFDFNGIYVTEFGVYSSLSQVKDFFTGNVYDSNLRTQLDADNSLIYLLKTRLDITATYDIPNQEQKVEQDYIQSIICFTPARTSFTPIYSETIAKNSFIGLAGATPVITTVESKQTIIYNQEEYVIKSQYNSQPEVTRSYEYDRGTLIDNAQLLFVMANLGLATNEEYQLPGVSSQYGEAKILSILNDGIGTNDQEALHENGLTVNGENYSEQAIKVKRYTYRLSDVKTTGIQQYVYVTNGSCGNLGNREIMYKYIEPLSSIGTIKPLGVLEYTLIQANFN